MVVLDLEDSTIDGWFSVSGITTRQAPSAAYGDLLEFCKAVRSVFEDEDGNFSGMSFFISSSGMPLLPTFKEALC